MPGIQNEFQDSQIYAEKPCLEKTATNVLLYVCTCLWVPTEARRGGRSPGAGVSRTWDLLGMGAGNHSSEHHVLLTIELSF